MRNGLLPDSKASGYGAIFCAMRRIKTIAAAAVIGVGLAGGLGALARHQPYRDDKLTQRDSAGKITRYDGLVELLALKQCSKLDDATRDKTKKAARDWLLDVQQQVIDNLDFVAEIEPFDGKPGVFDVFDPANPKALERVNTYGRQLNSPGTLINQLEFRRLVDSKQAESLRRMVYDYDQEVLREVAGDGKDQAAASRHMYRVGYRDSIGMFHRLLDRAAEQVDAAAASLKLPDGVSITSQVAAVKAAGDKDAKRVAVKALLAKLPLMQQRALMNKVKELTPITEPFSQI